MLLVAYLFSNKMEKVITDSLQVVANAQAAEMTDFCEQQRDYLTVMGNMNMSRAAMRGQLNDEMQGYLDNMLEARVQTMGYLDAIAIIDKDRRVAACGVQHDVFANEGIDPLIEMMGDKPFYISDTMPDEEGNKTLVAIAKIEDGEEVLGYVLAELCTDFYETIRERAELWNESTFYLLDGKGKIISAGTSDENRDSFVTTEAERTSQSIRDAVERHRNAHTGLAVLFVDIDDFKDFNNNYGHNVGDQALMFLASVLVRETNGTVGRVGGDEFVILIESPGDMAEMEERLVQVEKTAAERFVLRGSGVHLPVYCCIGAVTVDFSVYDAVELTCEKLMDMADHAMYQMKNGGKHGHVILEYSEKAGSREVRMT